MKDTAATKTSISMPEEMMVKAQSRVRGNYASFSSYVQELIRKDLETRNGMPVALAPQPSEVLP